MRGPTPPDYDDEQQEQEQPPTGPSLRGLLGWGLIGLLTVLVVWVLVRGFYDKPEFSRDRFREILAKPDAVTQVYVKGSTVHGELHPDYLSEFGTTKFTVQLYPDELPAMIGTLTETFGSRFARKGDDKNRPSYIPDDPLFWQTLIATVPWILILVLIWVFVSRQMRAASGPGGVLSFGRSRARLAKKEHVKVTFDDVAGIPEAKEEVKEIITFLKDPQRFRRLGGRIPRGVMLVGPPGTGKTLLAKAIAGEAEVPFFSISGSDFVEMFVGVGASRVRDLFRQAKQSSPCIIFLDEIDAVGRRRGMGYTGGHDEREQTLNAILVEMDGFETNEQVILIGATNRPDVLDPALRRPGRFDREIVIPLPDLNEREQILRVHARDVKLDEEADLGAVARGTPGFSGADLAAIINEAAIRATLLDKDAVEQDDLEESRDKVRWGREKRSRLMDEDERRLSAYHEAGHTLVSLCLEPLVEPLHKVSIIPRGMAMGSTMFLPEKDRWLVKRSQCLSQMQVAFGGRITEEILFQDVSSGASDDIRQATRLARRMVCDWGMSEKLGPVRYAPREETTPWGVEMAGGHEHSDETARLIDEEVQAILREAYEKARHLLVENREALERVATSLLEQEALSAAEVRAVIADLPLKRPEEAVRAAQEAEARKADEDGSDEAGTAPEA